MDSCIKVLESDVAARFIAIKRRSFQVVVDHSADFRILKILTARGTRWTSGEPFVNTFFAEEFFTFAALFWLPNEICANRANVVFLNGLSDPLIGC